MLDFTYIFQPGLVTLPLDAIRVCSRHRRELHLRSLIRSIVELGLLQPITVATTGLLIAGERRIEAFRALGRDEIPVHVVDLRQIVRGEYAENVERVGFTLSEMVAIKRELEPTLRAEAKERMTLGKISPGSDTGRTRDKIPAGLGVSGRTLEKAEAIVEAGEVEPERFGQLVEEMDRTGHAENIFRRLKIARQADGIRAEPPPLPNRGPYRCIVADPPWRYDLRDTDPSHDRILVYPTMPVADICALDVTSIAHRDCVLWLWTTNAHMSYVPEVLRAWGFEWKTVLTWCKDRMGLGIWLRGQTEHCVLAIRGNPTVQLTNQTTVLHAPVRAHSQKPEEFYTLVESLCPAPRYAYLFSREQRQGWDMHGDEVLRPAAQCSA
jgi:N6-adenosine-specific RNA methylase IME4